MDFRVGQTKTAGRAVARPAGVSAGRPHLATASFEQPGPLAKGARGGIGGYFFMLGHSQPFAQSSQQSHLQLQFGQSLQQSFEQQVPSLQTGALDAAGVDWPAIPAATRPAAINNPPNNLTNIVNSLS